MLLGPKVAALLSLPLDRDLLRQMGGWRTVAKGTLLEILISVVMAPVTMLTQTFAIVDILRGRRSGWLPQRREVDGLDFGEVVRFYRWHILLGLGLTAAMIVGIDGMICPLRSASFCHRLRSGSPHAATSATGWCGVAGCCPRRTIAILRKPQANSPPS
jgi:hypothetical protein